MKRTFINLQRMADAAENNAGGAPEAIAVMPAAMSKVPSAAIAGLVKTNLDRASNAKTEVIEVMVLSVSDWKPAQGAAGPLPTKMVVTNIGNFWPLANSIKNLPKSFFRPVAAKATVMPREIAAGARKGETTLQLSRLEFEESAGKDTLEMVGKMPAGTALFAAPVAE